MIVLASLQGKYTLSAVAWP